MGENPLHESCMFTQLFRLMKMCPLQCMYLYIMTMHHCLSYEAAWAMKVQMYMKKSCKLKWGLKNNYWCYILILGYVTHYHFHSSYYIVGFVMPNLYSILDSYLYMFSLSLPLPPPLSLFLSLVGLVCRLVCSVLHFSLDVKINAQ